MCPVYVRALSRTEREGGLVTGSAACPISDAVPSNPQPSSTEKFFSPLGQPPRGFERGRGGGLSGRSDSFSQFFEIDTLKLRGTRSSVTARRWHSTKQIAGQLIYPASWRSKSNSWFPGEAAACRSAASDQLHCVTEKVRGWNFRRQGEPPLSMRFASPPPFLVEG